MTRCILLGAEYNIDKESGWFGGAGFRTHDHFVCVTEPPQPAQTACNNPVLSFSGVYSVLEVVELMQV